MTGKGKLEKILQILFSLFRARCFRFVGFLFAQTRFKPPNLYSMAFYRAERYKYPSDILNVIERFLDSLKLISFFSKFSYLGYWLLYAYSL